MTTTIGRQRFTTLLGVELRKLIDTRSGKLLFGSAIALTIGSRLNTPFALSGAIASTRAT